MAHALVSIVLKELASVISNEAGSVIFKKAEKEVRLVLGTPEEVEKLTSTLKHIQAVLIDAEEEQVKKETVKLWLENLKDVLYDMEDVLDEWRTKILRSEKEEEVGVLQNVCSYLFSLCNCNWNCFSQVSLRRGIGRKIKDIKGRLDVIAKEKDQFQLIDSGMRTTTAELPTMTSSLIEELDVCGRDQDKGIILSKLLSESSQQQTPNVPVVISICGPGGMGKTTLAQMVFNDHEVKKHFEKRMWVCVSDPFDLTRLAKAIIKGAGGQNVSNNIEWQDLHQELCTSVMGKRFLLVLDDMWTEKHTDWSPLKLALNGGAQGSRIVVTTRSKKVTSMVDSAYTHDLGKLSEEECLVLFKRIAFHGWSKDECEKWEDIGVDIVKKCKGVPLFVKALGRHMNDKRTRREWEQVLESDVWGLDEVANGVVPALLLSYYALPSNVKRCFMYCAVFPKDHWIEKDELIKLWMAQGLLNSTESTKLEELGAKYFNVLLMRSFFQDLEQDDDRNIIGCKMHDLIHDFAQYLMKTECFIMDDNNTKFNNNSKKVRHLNVTRVTDLNSILPSIYEAKNLRTVIIYAHVCASHSLSDLFCQFTCLRELSLCNWGLEELPNEVEKLIHLRYFDLSGTSLKELPEKMCKLYNLQTLKLNGCDRLCKLPQGIGKMINLRHLEIQETNELSCLPKGIGRLSSLRTLCKFIVGDVSGGGCKIGELKDLDHLEGDLEIFGLERVANVNEANEAHLKNKRYLHGLKLIFECNGSGNMGEDEIKRIEGVLEGLQPHPKLEELRINGYLGSKFPNWMDDSMLPNLHVIKLNDCKKCVQFPAFGKFQFLQKLCIANMDSVKRIGVEFLGINVDVDDDGGGESRVVIAFPKLKKLDIRELENLEEWEMLTREEKEEHVAGSGGRDRIMPRLHKLYLYDCPKLKELPHYIFSASLRNVDISLCPKLSWTPCLPPLLEKLTLYGDVGVLSRALPTNQVNDNLMSLSIWRSPHSSLPEGSSSYITTMDFSHYL